MLEIIDRISDKPNIISEIKNYCDEVKRCRSGNIIALIRGTDPSADSIMLAVHTDIPHFICTGVDDEGIAELSPVGSLKVSGAHLSPLISSRGIRAILLTEGTDTEPVFKADIGNNDGRVHNGDIFNIVRPTDILSDNVAVGFGLSVNVPIAALLGCARALHESRPCRDVYLAFTAEGQYDFKLYASAASETGADLAVCIGAVNASERCVSVGEGAYVRLCDKSFSSDKPLSDALVSAGAVPLVISKGVCAASRIQVNGTPSAQLELPVKYLNTVCESIRLTDAEAVRDVLISLCQK